MLRQKKEPNDSFASPAGSADHETYPLGKASPDDDRRAKSGGGNTWAFRHRIKFPQFTPILFRPEPRRSCEKVYNYCCNNNLQTISFSVKVGSARA
jgi:hypothetical protein